MLAAIDNEPACVCQLSRRVQSSSVTFLPLQRRQIRDALMVLSANGLVSARPSQCDQGCDAVYSLSPRGHSMLDVFMDQVGRFELAIRRKRNVMTGT